MPLVVSDMKITNKKARHNEFVGLKILSLTEINMGPERNVCWLLYSTSLLWLIFPALSAFNLAFYSSNNELRFRFSIFKVAF